MDFTFHFAPTLVVDLGSLLPAMMMAVVLARQARFLDR